MAGASDENAKSVSPSEEQVQQWALRELGYFGDTLKKKATLEASGSGSRLNDLLFTRFNELCSNYNVIPDQRVLAGLLPSVRSALGNSCERLLSAYGARAVELGLHGILHGASGKEASENEGALESAGKLQAYILGSDYKASIQSLRKSMTKAAKTAAKQQRTRERRKQTSLLPADEGVDPIAAVDEEIVKTAALFYVEVSTVSDLVRQSKKEISYPDSVSVFENEVRVAEHKLSGETDSKNTDANVRKLLQQCALFKHLDRRITAMAVLPFPKKGVQARWKKEFRLQTGSDLPHNTAVYTDSSVFAALFGSCPDPEGEYERFLLMIASVGANRLFHAFAPPHLSTDGMTWKSTKPLGQAGDGLGPVSYVLTVPAGIAEEDLAALFGLLSSVGASVTPS